MSETGDVRRHLDRKIYENSGNKTVLAIVNPAVGKRILDLGCGAGANARAMVASGGIVTGVTLSSEEGRKVGREGIPVAVADLRRQLPFHREARFDVVVLSHVLEHLAEPSAILSAAGDLLAPGGTIVVAVPSVTHYTVRLRLLRGDWTYQESGILDWTHLRFFSRPCIQRVLEEAGLAVVEERHEGAFPLWRMRRLLPCVLVDWVNGWSARIWPELFAVQFVFLLTRR